MIFSKTDDFLDRLQKGCFLSVKDRDGNVNVMTIGWAAIGIMWGKKVFFAPVRPSRYTFELLDNAIDYCVSVPRKDEYSKELIFCGTKSGRDFDKFKECDLKMKKMDLISSPGIESCEMYYSCRLMMVLKTDSSVLPDSIISRYFPNGDDHYLFIGEILE